jgi:hypothetical protein
MHALSGRQYGAHVAAPQRQRAAGSCVHTCVAASQQQPQQAALPHPQPPQALQQHARDLATVLLVNENLRRAVGRCAFRACGVAVAGVCRVSGVRRCTGARARARMCRDDTHAPPLPPVPRPLLEREQLLKAVELLDAADYALLVCRSDSGRSSSSNDSTGISESSSSSTRSSSSSATCILYANAAARAALLPHIDSSANQQQSPDATSPVPAQQQLPQAVRDALQQQQQQPGSCSSATGSSSSSSSSSGRAVVLAGVSWPLQAPAQRLQLILPQLLVLPLASPNGERCVCVCVCLWVCESVCPGAAGGARPDVHRQHPPHAAHPPPAFVHRRTDTAFGAALLFPRWRYSNGALGAPGWPAVSPQQLPSAQQLRRAADAVRQQADAVRALKRPAGASNRDEAVVAAVAELQARKQQLARLEGLAHAFLDSGGGSGSGAWAALLQAMAASGSAQEAP